MRKCSGWGNRISAGIVPREFLSVFLAACVFTFYPDAVFPDTIYLKDGSEVKGIIVEEYKDRVIVSTEYGETEMSKDEIKKINYDLAEQNLVSMADKYMQIGDYEKAYFYYEKAKKVNPDYKEAIEGSNYLSGYLFRKELTKKTDYVNWRQTVEDFQRNKSEEGGAPADMLRRVVGMDIIRKDKEIIITKVYSSSPAEQAGVEEGDVISSVWGVLTKYMSEKEVTEELIKPEHLEVKILIDRDVPIEPDVIHPSQLQLTFEGLSLRNISENTKAYGCGVRSDDLILTIDGESIRYTPIKDVTHQLKSGARNVMLRREITIWRKKEG